MVVLVDYDVIEGERSRSFRDLVEGSLAEAWLTPRRLVLDLASVRRVDPSAIAVLIRARARLVPWGGSLEVRNACPLVRSAIEALGLAERLGLAPRTTIPSTPPSADREVRPRRGGARPPRPAGGPRSAGPRGGPGSGGGGRRRARRRGRRRPCRGPATARLASSSAWLRTGAAGTPAASEGGDQLVPLPPGQRAAGAGPPGRRPARCAPGSRGPATSSRPRAPASAAQRWSSLSTPRVTQPSPGPVEAVAGHPAAEGATVGQASGAARPRSRRRARRSWPRRWPRPRRCGPGARGRRRPPWPRRPRRPGRRRAGGPRPVRRRPPAAPGRRPTPGS